MTIIERSTFIQAAPEAVTAVTAVSYTLEYTLADSAKRHEMGRLISQ